eukprot:CAMPEP_0184496734 /NCGR_PEP_ID=MMETSP0113_2-20130426/34748_1 /TAXON_ID=91329 /ORGANISM="Norrisiella sphaerica, Strain BC52" /LENGTH=910 /DNA_ID=CAMNT_0026883507 /DNA_START=342 /DNA_END=3074 /DNA_ORIENTATION=+
MGGLISIQNDTKETFQGDIIDVEGEVLEEWEISIKPGDTYSIEDKTLRVGDQYRLRMMLGSDEMDRKEDDQILFVFKNDGTLKLKVTELMEQQKLRNLEVEHLFEQILPGIRIEDTVFHGKKYEKSFFAKELVTYLVVHGVAQDVDDAVEKCRVLAEANILVFLCDPMIQMLIDCDMYDAKRNPVSNEFQNKSLLYRLGETHPIVKDRFKNFAMDEFGSKVLRFKSKQNRLLSYRGLEGWLEKKKRLGFWQRRYFRVLSHNDEETGRLLAQLAYFDNNISLEPKGWINLNFVQHVDLVDKKKRSFAVKMLRTNDGKSNYVLRAVTPEVASHWLSFLRLFSKVLSPVDTIQRSVLVCTLSDAQIHDFAKYLKPKIVKKGKWIIKRGSVIDHCYFLEIGKVGIYTGNLDGKEKHYWDMEPISFFGENMIFDTESVNGVSIKAEEDCELRKLSTKDWKMFLTEHSSARGQLRNMLEFGINRAIELVPFLKGLKPTELEILRLGLHYEVLEEGKVLFYEGDPGDKFYIVHSGSLKIARHNPRTEEETVLGECGKGAVFGEISLMLPNVPRTATIIAQKRSILISLKGKFFKDFVKIAGLDIRTVMRESIVNTFHQYKIPFFDAIPRDTYRQFAEALRIECHEADQVIFKEGEEGDKFYIIYLGEISVSVGGRPLVRLGEGQYFGEIAIVVEDLLRTATVRTTKRTVLLSMSKDDFRGFFAERPEALADVELRIAGRKCQIRSIIYHPKGIELFTSYLKSQYAEESIEFWHEARAFRKWAKAKNINDKFDRKQLDKKATELMEKYIRPESDRQVNISASMAKRVIKEVESGEASASTFLESEGEIITLISRDKLGPFKFSPEFEKLMEVVGGYNLISTKHAKRLRGGSGDWTKDREQLNKENAERKIESAKHAKQ